MKGNNLGYLIKEGARNVWVNRLMSLASIGVLVACLLLMGGAMLISYNITQAVGYVEDQNSVVVFLDEGVTQEQIDSVGTKIKNMDNVLEAKFVSKDQALENMMNDMDESADLMEGLLTENPLLDSYEIRVDDLSQLTQTTDAIEKLGNIYKIVSPTEAASTLTSVKRIVSIAGGVIVLILFAVSIMIIANTIKITVFNRRKEVSIMKYVGATDSFIRFPFVIEGIIIGVFSALVAYGILWLGYQYALEHFLSGGSSWLQGVAQSFIPFRSIAGVVAIGFFGAGIGIGAGGSLIFVRKYLKV